MGWRDTAIQRWVTTVVAVLVGFVVNDPTVTADTEGVVNVRQESVVVNAYRRVYGFCNLLYVRVEF